MRTKALLCAAALAAGALTSMAQVYSANVVGYVNATVLGNFNYNMIANPLDATVGGTVPGGNNITNLFPPSVMTVARDGAQILRWNPNIADFQGDTWTYDGASAVWRKDGGADLTGFALNPGEGIFFVGQGPDLAMTYVGQVIQGSYPLPVFGSFDYNSLGSPVPLGGNFTNSVYNLTLQDGDTIATWNLGLQDLDPNLLTYSIASHSWSGSGPPFLNVNIAPGIGFFYVSGGGTNVTWDANFSVQ